MYFRIFFTLINSLIIQEFKFFLVVLRKEAVIIPKDYNAANNDLDNASYKNTIDNNNMKLIDDEVIGGEEDS